MTQLSELFRIRAATQPNHLAIIGPEPDTQITYAQLASRINTYVDGLRSAGVDEGSTVGLHYESGTQYIVAAYAIWKCGGCVVPIPVELKPNEKTDILQRIGLSHVLSSNVTKIDLAPYAIGTTTPLQEKGSIVSIDSPVTHPPEFASVNAAFIRFTSGTTGSSKGIVLSHETIYDRIYAANDVLEISPSDRVVWLLSMSYHFTVSVVGYLTLGATVIQPEHLFAKGIINAIRDHQATAIYGSPLHYAQLSRGRKNANIPRLRLAVSTTTGLKKEVASAFEDRFGMVLTQAYGIIELGLPCINRDFASNHPESVGRVLPTFDIRLLPHDHGASPYGEILFRGKGILDAYYDPWKPRHEIMHDGWFHTGDLGEIDKEGCVSIRGRIKEVISIAGMKVFPQEVEAVLKEHSEIADAVVYGVPHPRFGQIVHASVQLRSARQSSPTVQSLREFCGTRMTDYKVPEQINFVDGIQRTASGKPIRRSLEPVEILT